MKKKLLTLLTLLTVVALVFGCSTGNKPSSNEQPNTSNESASNGQTETTEPAVEIKGELVFAGNGATVEELFKDKIFPMFNEQYPDVKLTYVAGVATEIVAKVKAGQGNQLIDIAFIESGEQENGRAEGLWEALNPEEITNMSKVGEKFLVKENSGVTVNYTPMGISYNADLVEANNLPVPTSWNDLTLPEMKDNLTMTEISSNFGRSPTIMLSYANGGDENNMEPGFEKLGIIAGYMPTFAKSAAQLTQNLQDQSAVYTTWTMARSIIQKEQNGLPLEFVIPEEGTNVVPTIASLVTGAKNPEAAKVFINFLLTDEVQKLFATDLYYNPVVDVELPADLASLLEFDSNKVVNFDLSAISQNMPTWLDRFNKEIAPLVGK